MKTFFVRHSGSWNVDEEFRQELWEQTKIAIKFQDIRSRNLDDYYPKARGAIRRLCDLADNGGYVCATIYPFRGCLVAKVKPGTKITFQKIRNPDTNLKTAIAKVIQLRGARRIEDPFVANRLLIGQPQQGTITEWRNIGDRVANIFKFGFLQFNEVSDLLPYEQEVMCAEFLRTSHAKTFSLPTLVHLSALVGHNRRTIDVAGVTARGSLILAQVTHAEDGSPTVREKLKSLREVGGSSKGRLILFCRAPAFRKDDGISIVPIEEVFRTMMKLPAWKAALRISDKHRP